MKLLRADCYRIIAGKLGIISLISLSMLSVMFTLLESGTGPLERAQSSISLLSMLFANIFD